MPVGPTKVKSFQNNTWPNGFATCDLVFEGQIVPLVNYLITHGIKILVMSTLVRQTRLFSANNF